MRGPLPVAVGGNAMALLSKEFLNQYKDRPAHMTPLGLFILLININTSIRSLFVV